MFVVILPWLIFNARLFGGPFWSQPFQRTLAGGSRQVEYVLVDGEAVKRNLRAQAIAWPTLRERAIDLYGNVGFIAKQSLVLAPVLGGLFLLGLLLLAGRCHIDACLALVHLALIIWWPTTKFRYLIPLLPLVFAIGAWALWQLRPESVRHRLAIVTLGLCLFTNAWTMLSIPSRTYYYDGGLIGDNFGQQGERQFVDEARELPSSRRRHRGARARRDAGRPHPVAVHADAAGRQLDRLPARDHQHLVQTYGIRYIVIDRAHASDCTISSKPTPLWSDDRLVVLELPECRAAGTASPSQSGASRAPC